MPKETKGQRRLRKKRKLPLETTTADDPQPQHAGFQRCGECLCCESAEASMDRLMTELSQLRVQKASLERRLTDEEKEKAKIEEVYHDALKAKNELARRLHRTKERLATEKKKRKQKQKQPQPEKPFQPVSEFDAVTIRQQQKRKKVAKQSLGAAVALEEQRAELMQELMDVLEGFVEQREEEHIMPHVGPAPDVRQGEGTSQVPSDSRRASASQEGRCVFFSGW